MAKYVIKATIVTDTPEVDLMKLYNIFHGKVSATFDALQPTWEEVWDGYETMD